MSEVYSMTGYSRVQDEVSGSGLVVEAKSINHRYLDIKLHLPRELQAFEPKVIKLCRSFFERGRIEVWVSSEPGERPVEVSWNRPLAEALLRALNEIKQAFNLADEPTLELLAHEKDVILISDSFSWTEEAWPELSALLSDCFQALLEMRRQEGDSLARDILSRINDIEAGLDEVEKRSEAVVEAHKDRLETRIKELSSPEGDFDQERLAQEVAIFANRSDITEEVVRTRSHLARVREVMEGEGAKGRKLDFLVQEIFREVTTATNKAQDAQVSAWAVEIKAELEKIREQVQNLE